MITYIAILTLTFFIILKTNVDESLRKNGKLGQMWNLCKDYFIIHVFKVDFPSGTLEKALNTLETTKKLIHSGQIKKESFLYIDNHIWIIKKALERFNSKY